MHFEVTRVKHKLLYIYTYIYIYIILFNYLHVRFLPPLLHLVNNICVFVY